jgi:hypothetical protein
MAGGQGSPSSSMSEVLIGPIRSSQTPALLACTPAPDYRCSCESERLAGRPDGRLAGRANGGRARTPAFAAAVYSRPPLLATHDRLCGWDRPVN